MLALPLLLYALYAGGMYANQQAMLFPAASSKHHALDTAPPGNGRVVELAASFGDVRAVYLRDAALTARAPAAIYLHGNFECIQDSFALLQPLVASGLAVLQVEFPGFCGADGAPTFTAVNEAALAAFDWLAAQGDVDASRIVVMGYSMGGGVAAELSAHRTAKALVLLSTYTSIEDLAHRFALPGLLIRYPYDTRARLRAFDGPVFVEHGRRDAVIPFAMGRALADTARAAEFLPLDCGHDDCRFDRAVFARRLPAWLAQHDIIQHDIGEPAQLVARDEFTAQDAASRPTQTTKRSP